jgi:hypothetical protein
VLYLDDDDDDDDGYSNACVRLYQHVTQLLTRIAVLI